MNDELEDTKAGSLDERMDAPMDTRKVALRVEAKDN
jgi:hypothetical protein